MPGADHSLHWMVLRVPALDRGVDRLQMRAHALDGERLVALLDRLEDLHVVLVIFQARAMAPA